FFAGTLAPGESTEFTVNVPPGQELLAAYLYSDSTCDILLEIEPPPGETGGDASWSYSRNDLAPISIESPASGSWTIRVTAASANHQSGHYIGYVLIYPSTLPHDTTPGFTHHTGSLAPGSAQTYTITVSEDTECLWAAVAATGDMILELINPNGVKVESTSSREFNRLEIFYPLPGTWTVRVKANEDISYYDCIIAALPAGGPPAGCQLTVAPGSPTYSCGSVVTLTACLTCDSTPIEGVTVAFQVNDPNGNPIASRTGVTDESGCTTVSFTLPATAPEGTYTVYATASYGGQTYQDQATFQVTCQACVVDIVSVTPCDQFGNPKESFERGQLASFKVELQASGTCPQILVTVNVYDSGSYTLGVASIYGPIAPGTSTWIISFPIPDWAQPGQATVYVNCLSDWPQNGGVPLTEEETATFQITSG
ncbi:MAG: hypothetical protein DRN99_07940, partial [Thermoproteota archaeon]